jgi:hypothetical protein
MEVFGPTEDGCASAYADDSFECTYPPADYECPGLGFVPTTAGTHTVLVTSIGTCDSAIGDYSLANDGGFDMTLTEDDAPSYEFAETCVSDWESDEGACDGSSKSYTLESSATF